MYATTSVRHFSVLFCSLVSRLNVLRRSGGLDNLMPSPGSAVPSIWMYVSRFRVWSDGQHFAAISGVWSFQSRTEPSGVTRECSASTRQKGCCTLCARGGDIIPSEHVIPSTDMPFFLDLVSWATSAAWPIYFLRCVVGRPLCPAGCQ